MSAAGLLLLPILTTASLADPNPTTELQSKVDTTPVIEVTEDAAVGNKNCTSADEPCETGSIIAGDRDYLIETAHPGGTMVRQGPSVAIGRLHPEFVSRLAAAIRDAREQGLKEVGIFSAYRPPAFGVGGFSDKFNSLHSYGLAVDMHGIGGPGSSEAKLWTKVAAQHGVVCPYGVNNRAEFNHCQPTRIKMVKADSPLRKTIKAEGPVSPPNMFDAGKSLIESVASLFSAFTNPMTAPPEDRNVAYAARSRRVRTADVRGTRQHRVKGRKDVRVAAAHSNARVSRHAAKQGTGKQRVAAKGGRQRTVTSGHRKSQRTRSAQLH
jgi:hypothetical protein